MIGVPSGALSLHGHCTLPSWSSLSKLTPAKVGVSAAISSMISRRMRVVHRIAERVGERDRDLPIRHARLAAA